MKLAMRSFAAIFLVFLLVLGTEVSTKVVEARICGTPSHKFKGICVSSRNCESVCKTERFPGGSCKGFRRRCICNTPCV